MDRLYFDLLRAMVLNLFQFAAPLLSYRTIRWRPWLKFTTVVNCKCSKKTSSSEIVGTQRAFHCTRWFRGTPVENHWLKSVNSRQLRSSLARQIRGPGWREVQDRQRVRPSFSFFFNYKSNDNFLSNLSTFYTQSYEDKEACYLIIIKSLLFV